MEFTISDDETPCEFGIDRFVGTYKYVGGEGSFDDFLKEAKVGFMHRKLALTATPNLEFTTEEDGSIIMKVLSIIKSQTYKFRLGEEFTEKRLDGLEVKTVFTKDGNKLIQKSYSDEVPETTVIREFIGREIIATCKCNDVTCIRKYKHV